MTQRIIATLCALCLGNTLPEAIASPAPENLRGDWSLDLESIAEIWRAGCIIRSALLDDIAEAFRGVSSSARARALRDLGLP